MDWNRVEGNWKEMKGKVKEQWGKLTDDDLDVIAGKQDQLERLRERSGPQGNRRLVRSADLVSEGKAPGERGFYRCAHQQQDDEDDNDKSETLPPQLAGKPATADAAKSSGR